MLEELPAVLGVSLTFSTAAGSLHQRWAPTLSGTLICIVLSGVVAEFIGYFLHRLLHSDKIRSLSHSHMVHHLLLYGPQEPQRPGPDYRDATTGKIALGNIGLEWIAPSGLFLSLFLGIFWFLGVPLLYQVIFAVVTLSWSFLMFSYLHDRMHIQGFWMARNRWLRRWFVAARRLHDIHHWSLSDEGLMNRNFGIGFYFFDRLFGTLAEKGPAFNDQGFEAAKQRYAFLQEENAQALPPASD